MSDPQSIIQFANQITRFRDRATHLDGRLRQEHSVLFRKELRYQLQAIESWLEKWEVSEAATK